MKKVFLPLLLLITSVLSAQNVNIPDANFKAALLSHDPVIDVDGDGEIHVSEALAVLEVNVGNYGGIQDLIGIEEFLGLTELYCYGNSITSIDVSALSNLSVLNMSRNDVSTIDVSQNLQLEWFFCNDNPVGQIDVSNNANLERINFSATLIQDVDLTNNVDLRLARIDETSISSLDVTNCPDLVLLDISSTSIAEIDLSNNIVMDALDTSGSQITQLDLSNNNALELLYVVGCPISNLDLSSNTEMRLLNIGNTDIEQLDVSMLTELKVMNMRSSKLLSLDLSNNPNLCYIDGTLSTELENVNLKNGANLLLTPGGSCGYSTTYGGYSGPSGIVFQGCDVLDFICVDDAAFAELNFVFVPADTVFVETCFFSIEDAPLATLQLYPNPVSDRLTITSDIELSAVEVLSVLGQSVKKEKVSGTQTSVSLEDLSDGIYFVRVTSGNTSQVMQIIKE